jgi:hypothetical protein
VVKYILTYKLEHPKLKYFNKKIKTKYNTSLTKVAIIAKNTTL